jgi:hypothetical protein
MIDKNKIKAYCYIITRLSDNKKYFGVRWANIKFKRTPNEDFGKYYFSSHKILKKEFKKYPERFKFEITNTFDDKESAIDYEAKKNKSYIYDDSWLNKQAYPAILNNTPPMLGKNHSDKTKITLSKKRKELSKQENITDAMKRGFKKISEFRKGKPSGMLGKNHSESVKKRMSKSRIGNKSNTGRKLTEQHRFNISQGQMGRPGTMKGKKHSAETLKKMSASHMGNKSNLGNKASYETKLKMSLAQKKRFSNPVERKKISTTLKIKLSKN